MNPGKSKHKKAMSVDEFLKIDSGKTPKQGRARTPGNQSMTSNHQNDQGDTLDKKRKTSGGKGSTEKTNKQHKHKNSGNKHNHSIPQAQHRHDYRDMHGSYIAPNGHNVDSDGQSVSSVATTASVGSISVVRSRARRLGALPMFMPCNPQLVQPFRLDDALSEVESSMEDDSEAEEGIHNRTVLNAGGHEGSSEANMKMWFKAELSHRIDRAIMSVLINLLDK